MLLGKLRSDPVSVAFRGNATDGPVVAIAGDPRLMDRSRSQVDGVEPASDPGFR